MRESYLVTGGGGLLGRHIVDQLLARGETSVAVFDLAPGEQDSRTRVFAGDITDRQAVEDAVKTVSLTLALHKYAVTDSVVVWCNMHHPYRRCPSGAASGRPDEDQRRRDRERPQRRQIPARC